MPDAIFLDRDGVLNEDKAYVYKPSDLTILSGVPKALAELKRRGYLLIVITNQSGVARGMFSLADVENFNSVLETQIKAAGGPASGFDAVYICPHHPDGIKAPYNVECACRKPGTKLVDDAVARFGINRAQSFLIGDKDSDVACGLAAGLKTIQIDKQKTALHPKAHAVAASLADALRFIPPALSSSSATS